MAQKCWGIDIGSVAVKAVCVQKSKTGVTVLDTAYIPFEKQTEDKIERISQVRGAIEELVNTKKVGSIPVVVSLMGHNALHKVFELPPIPKNKVAELVGFEARQQIPFDLEDVVWDYQVTSDFQPGEQVEISLFAIKRDVIDDFLAVISEFNLNIDALQLNSLASYNFIAYEKPMDEKPVVMVDIGANNCEFIIVNKGKYYVRKLTVSGNNFSNLLSEKFKISFEEAQELKHSMAESKQAEKLQRVLSPKWRDFVGELQRSLGYYKTIWRDLDLEKLFLVGGTANLAGFDDYLQNNLGFKAESINQTSVFDFAPSVAESDFQKKTAEMSAALGLALQGVGKVTASINLMPPALAQAKALKAKRPIIALSLVAFILSLVVSWVVVDRDLKQVKKLKVKIDKALKKVSKVEKNYKAEYTKIEPLQQEIQYLTSMYIGRNMVLDVQNSLLNLLKKSNTKFISLKSEQIVEDEDKVDDPAQEKEKEIGFSFGGFKKAKKVKVKKETEIMDLRSHSLKFNFIGRILVSREIAQEKQTFADPKINDGDAFTVAKIDRPPPKKFNIQQVTTKALQQRIVSALKQDGRPKFSKVELVDISPETVTFSSTRNVWFRVCDKDGSRESPWFSVTTETTEKYKRFEVSWECSE